MVGRIEPKGLIHVVYVSLGMRISSVFLSSYRLIRLGNRRSWQRNTLLLHQSFFFFLCRVFVSDFKEFSHTLLTGGI